MILKARARHSIYLHTLPLNRIHLLDLAARVYFFFSGAHQVLGDGVPILAHSFSNFTELQSEDFRVFGQIAHLADKREERALY